MAWGLSCAGCRARGDFRPLTSDKAVGGERRRSVNSFRLLVGLVVGALLLVSDPALAAAKPTRTVIVPEPILIPAGFGCPFDVGGEPDDKARQTITEFSDGRVQTIGRANPTLTNLDTGKSIVHHSSYKLTQTYNSDTDEVVLSISGKFFITLYPGDQGPFGVVGENGALLSITGNQYLTLDPETEVITSYSLDGQATDLCALLDS